MTLHFTHLSIIQLRSSEVLAHEDEGKVSLGASIVLEVSDPRVQCNVFGPRLRRIEMNEIEPCAPSFGFRELKESPSKALSAMTRINCDVVDEKAFVGNGEDEYSHDRSVALCDRYSMVADDTCVIVGHRAR